MSGAHRTNFDHYLARHQAGHAGTVRMAESIAGPANGAHRHQVAEYARHKGEPFRVLHDMLVHPPYGLFRVYLNGQQIGKQLSFPSADDCRAMERPMRYGEPSGDEGATQYGRMQMLGRRRGRQIAEESARRRETGTKGCAMCLKVLALSAFRQLADGRRHSYCNPCRSERETARYTRARGGKGRYA